MALSKVADARKLSDAELAEAVVAAKKKLFELRLQQATRRLEKTHEFKHTRHWIAQLLTVERERQLATELDEGIAASPSPEPETTADNLDLAEQATVTEEPVSVAITEEE